MDVGFNISRRQIFLIIAFSIAVLILSGFGIYYFVSGEFDTNAVVISAMIILSFAALQFFYKRQESVNTNLGALGLPSSFFIAIFLGLGDAILPSLIGIALNYLAIFAVVNFIQRIFREINL